MWRHGKSLVTDNMLFTAFFERAPLRGLDVFLSGLPVGGTREMRQPGILSVRNSIRVVREDRAGEGREPETLGADRPFDHRFKAVVRKETRVRLENMRNGTQHPASQK